MRDRVPAKGIKKSTRTPNKTGHVFNYKTDAAGKNGTTKLFDTWDTGDSDVFVSGDIGGKAGAMLNIDFGQAFQGNAALLIGDWNVWIKPLDFLTIKASNEANRVANRYNSIIDKTESKWGTLVIGGTGADLNYKDANDDDSFKGYQVNMDFGVVKVDLGFNKAIQENGFAASSMEFADNKTEIGAGARVVVPVEGLLNVDALFKMYMKNVDGTVSSTTWIKWALLCITTLHLTTIALRIKRTLVLCMV